MSCSEILQIMAIVANFIICFIAIFGDSIRRIFFKPKLVAKIESLFPYCSFSQFESGKRCFICRMIIENEGKTDARNVQVYLNKVEYKSADGNFVTCTNVLPINLNWSYQEKSNNSSSVAELISPKMEKYCDFMYITENMNYCVLNTEFQFSSNGTTNNVLPKGIYKAHIVIFSSNSKPLKYIIEFEYSGTWSSDISEVIKSITMEESK